MKTTLIVAFELVTVLAMLVVILIQRPGVVTEQYAAKHGELQTQRKKAEAARLVENRFRDERQLANFILFKGAGLGLWALGLCIVIVSAPKLWSPLWINDVVTGFGLALQAAATGLFIFFGIALSRSISRAVKAVENE